MTLQSDIKKAQTLIENSQNPIMFFDTDTDGASSFIQLKKTYSQLKEGYPISKDSEQQKLALEKIFDNHDLIIFFDTPHIIEEFFDEINGRQTLWVDHHIPTNEKIIENKKNKIFYLNPMNYDKTDERCASYFAYEITQKTENLIWATLASIADFYLLDIIKKFHDHDPNNFKILINIPEQKKQELFTFLETNKFNDETKQNQRAEWIQYLTYGCGLIKYKTFFDILFKFEKFHKTQKILKNIAKMSFAEFTSELENGKIGIFETYQEIMSEYKQLIKKIDKLKDEDLIYIEHENKKISYNRQLSEETAFKKQNYKAIVSAYTKDTMNIYSCSFRGKNFDINKMLTECINGLSGQGGGHKFASGCIISKSDYPEFKKRIQEYMKKNSL